MNRRSFLLLAAAAGSLPRWALAQAAARRVAILSIPQPAQYFAALRQGLAEHGWVEGKSLVLDTFTAPTNADLAAFATEAVQSAPDVIFTIGTPASLATKAVTSTVPIVFGIVADPIGVGLVTNLSKPGGNITGNTNQAPGLVGKQLSILRELIPTLNRLVILNVPSDASSVLQNQQAMTAATALGIEPVLVDLVDGQDLGSQFAQVVAAKPQAVYGPTNTYLNGNRDVLFDLFLRNALPAMTGAVVDGAMTPFIGVVSYGPSNPEIIRNSASLVDAVLRGAQPGDLAVEQPSAFQLAVNIDTAKKIGLAIPAAILAQATWVVSDDWRGSK